MACSSKSSKLWSAMSAILCRGFICCFDNMVQNGLICSYWLDDIFFLSLVCSIIYSTPPPRPKIQKITEVWCQESFLLADLLLDCHCYNMHNHAISKGVCKWNNYKHSNKRIWSELNWLCICSMYNITVNLHHNLFWFGLIFIIEYYPFINSIWLKFFTIILQWGRKNCKFVAWQVQMGPCFYVSEWVYDIIHLYNFVIEIIFTSYTFRSTSWTSTWHLFIPTHQMRKATGYSPLLVFSNLEFMIVIYLFLLNLHSYPFVLSEAYFIPFELSVSLT